jgi:hypothetical protein
MFLPADGGKASAKGLGRAVEYGEEEAVQGSFQSTARVAISFTAQR